MSWLDLFYHPLWVVSAAVLAAVLRLQRRLRWTPGACDVRLTGKTAIVTGANTGKRDPLTAVWCQMRRIIHPRWFAELFRVLYVPLAAPMC